MANKRMDALINAFSQVPPPFNMVIAIIAIICVTNAFGEVIKQVRLYADHEADRRLKRDMLEAGYNAEEAREFSELAITQDYEPQKASV